MGFSRFRWMGFLNVTGVDWNGPEWTRVDIFLREFRLTGFWKSQIPDPNHRSIAAAGLIEDEQWASTADADGAASLPPGGSSQAFAHGRQPVATVLECKLEMGVFEET
jgi:hypothetical protein